MAPRNTEEGEDAPLHERLMTRHPLPTERARKRAAEGLADAATAYAKHAAYCGSTGPWWRVWRALERTQGRRLRGSLATLQPEAKRWFALWSFARGRGREGAVAYRAYVAAPGPNGPLDRDNSTYLEHVVRTGSLADVVRIGNELIAQTSHSDRVHLIVLQALLAIGSGAEVLRQFVRPTAASLHDGDAWARYTIAQEKHGDASEAEFALTMAAKLGVGTRQDASLREALFDALHISPARWEELRRPWNYPEGDLHANWLKDRGLRPEPTNEPSPHVYGGDEFFMPPCPGCGHRMHAFFVFDVQGEPALRARIPGWAWLPLVGCVDCCLWLMRRDFRVDQERRAVEVLGVTAIPVALATYGVAVGNPLVSIGRQPVKLRAIDESDPTSDLTQIGGQPDWVQDFERAFCPVCHNEMVFVAALASMLRSGFVPELTINNGSGYQYHFACAPCGTLAVFGQNT